MCLIQLTWGSLACQVTFFVGINSSKFWRSYSILVAKISEKLTSKQLYCCDIYQLKYLDDAIAQQSIKIFTYTICRPPPWRNAEPRVKEHNILKFELFVFFPIFPLLVSKPLYL
ncbi:hypothetical protein NIES2098_62120 [Calothrix sp. NIES-2098]|nr:hypothetical protein NIES2098_62120 [Calothrix sp. NIES-2098]